MKKFLIFAAFISLSVPTWAQVSAPIPWAQQVQPGTVPSNCGPGTCTPVAFPVYYVTPPPPKNTATPSPTFTWPAGTHTPTPSNTPTVTSTPTATSVPAVVILTMAPTPAQTGAPDGYSSAAWQKDIDSKLAGSIATTPVPATSFNFKLIDPATGRQAGVTAAYVSASNDDATINRLATYASAMGWDGTHWKGIYTDIPNADTLTSSVQALESIARGYVYNGSSWDRQRAANGLAAAGSEATGVQAIYQLAVANTPVTQFATGLGVTVLGAVPYGHIAMQIYNVGGSGAVTATINGGLLGSAFPIAVGAVTITGAGAATMLNFAAPSKFASVTITGISAATTIGTYIYLMP
ncbi:MAG TPA: hypothetical protein VHE12_05765 [bacterium]|nr:hypothetical protein [bacterium]